MTAIKQDGPYDSRTLTKVFLGSSLALAATTVWMVLDDHSRRWRGYQEDFREIEISRNEADYQDAKNAAAPNEQVVEDELKKAEADVDAKSGDVSKAQKELDEAQARKEAADISYAIAKSFVDSYTYFFEDTGLFAANEVSEHRDYTNRLAGADDTLSKAGAEKEAAKLGVDAAKARLDAVQDPLLKAQKHRDEVESKVNAAKKKVDQIAHGFKNDWFRNRPGVDFLDPTEKVKQVVLNDLKDDYYFAQVRKVDRCQTCHLAIDRKGYDGALVYVEGKGIISVSKIAPRGDGQGYDVTLPSGKVDLVPTGKVKWQKSIEAPFTAHPDLDLYMTSSSPHPVDRFGCTVCHMGEGQSVTFTTATHSPNDEGQREEWGHKLNWAEREHWNWPQFPTRYVEASCLLCHPNNRRIPGAEKLNFGRETWERLSCVGCHKMKGYEDEAKRGPDLRRLASKALNKEWVAFWIENPARFRPKTNMPRFFNGPDSALVAPTKEEKDAAKTADADNSKRLYDYDVRDEVEIKAITRFLFSQSEAYASENEPFKLLDYKKGNAARGKTLFTARGCVGCHRIEPTEAEAQAVRSYAPDEFGPNLYNTAYKTTPQWVVTWVSNPKHYWSETRMPNLRIDPKDAQDIATYLIEGEGVKDEKLADAKPAGWVDDDNIDVATKNQLEYALKDYLEKDFTTADVNNILQGKPAKPNQPSLPESDLKARFLYLGERTIGQLGCFGCHYVKGMESRPGIGRDLSDIGDKNLTQVDWGFESVSRFAETKPKDKIRENRHEWLNLKVEHPRVFDRGKFKAPLDRSRMPQFNTTKFEREALVTYLLGSTGNRKVPDEYKYRPGTRRQNVIEGEWAIQRNNCKACHLFGVDRISVTNGTNPIEQPKLDANGVPMKSPITDEPVNEKAWLTGHVVLDNINLYGKDPKDNSQLGAALIQLYADAPTAIGKKVGEWVVVSSSQPAKTIDEVHPELFGGEADLEKVVEKMPPDVWGDDTATQAAKRSAQLAAIKKGLPWRNRGGTSLDKIIEARASEQLTFNPWQLSGKDKFDPDSPPLAPVEDAKTFGPPHLLNEGKKIQALWLQSFLKDPIEIRPALRPGAAWADANNASFAGAGGAHMPTYGFSDAETQLFSRYFAATDEESRLEAAAPRLDDIKSHVKAKEKGYQYRAEIKNRVNATLDEFQIREYFNVFIADNVCNVTERGDVSLSRALEEKTDGYAVDKDKEHPGWYSAAYRLYVNPDINCQKCHIVRGQSPAGTVDAWAPDLARIRERLRPDYLQNWIANPKTIIPGTKMAQLFFDGKQQNVVPGDVKGDAKLQVSSVVDWLMAGAPSVLEAYPKTAKVGSEVRLTSELVNLDAAQVEWNQNGTWTPMDESKGDFVRERSAARVTAIRVPVSSGARGKTFQVRVRDDRYAAIADVNVE
jgi:mono/diheme cytochrome c family protein